MGTIRLGKRTENKFPYVKDFVPLASLNDLVFTGWDIFEDNVYEAAGARRGAGQRNVACLEALPGDDQADACGVRPVLRQALHGTHVKKGKNKRDLADQVIEDIRTLRRPWIAW